MRNQFILTILVKTRKKLWWEVCTSLLQKEAFQQIVTSDTRN